MTKKRSSEISADENQEIFQEKVQFRKFSSQSENFSKIGEKSETGGNASWSQGDGRPCLYMYVLLYCMVAGHLVSGAQQMTEYIYTVTLI